MPDWLSSVVVAMIGLAGTLVVAYLGYRQWRQGRHDAPRAEVMKARRATYEELWRLVEKTHVDLRRDPSAFQGLPDRIAEINAYILANEPYLVDGDHKLVNQYLAALAEMVSWAKREGDPAVLLQMQATSPIPRGAIAVAKAFGFRDQLKERVRSAIQEH